MVFLLLNGYQHTCHSERGTRRNLIKLSRFFTRSYSSCPLQLLTHCAVLVSSCAASVGRSATATKTSAFRCGVFIPIWARAFVVTSKFIYDFVRMTSLRRKLVFKFYNKVLIRTIALAQIEAASFCVEQRSKR